MIKNVNGVWGRADSQVRKAFVEYFQDLFTYEGRREWGDVLTFISPVVTEQMNNSPCYIVSDEEIKEAAF